MVLCFFHAKVRKKQATRNKAAPVQNGISSKFKVQNLKLTGAGFFSHELTRIKHEFLY
jgi:hypothetical protein